MSNSSNTSSGGIGFAGLLTVLFIALKLTDVIDWSWVWVLAPIWICPILILIIFTAVILYSKFSVGRKGKARN